ncbi:hypothetical protein BRARA_H00980 [Brassica rapa]|uniref:Uncharacterized protein n=1 Tax=Brassica campestris TaxID=3711 RepID=A0A397YAB6_BRACM|nr:hypothetical protein BRARA_H00980 [Brassica rapa]
MITALSWIPKGSLKPVPDAAEPPSKEEIKELIESGAFTASVDGSDEDEEEMEEEEEEISEQEGFFTMEVDDVAAGMKELDMDNYDEEDDGIELFSSGRGDLYYPSNELDPYLKDAADDDDDEEDIDDTTIKPTDSLLATGSMDKTVKLWDLSNNEPSCIASHKPKAGAVFSISFSVDNPFLLAIGGSKGELHVWDTLLDANVSRKYGSKQS